VRHTDVVATLTSIAAGLDHSMEIVDSLAVFAGGLSHPEGEAGGVGDDFVHVEGEALGEDDTGVVQE
jgi:hypothetical protein